MASKHTVATSEEDYLEVDPPVPGQNYACISFISPETILVQRELFMFNKYMNQVCGEFEQKIDDIMKKASDTLKNKIQKEFRKELQYHLKYTYNQFKDKFDDFKYKHHDELEKQLNEHTNFKTNVRGVKVRGVYDS